MGLSANHEIYKRRMGRNIGVGLLLVGLVAIVFGLTVVKVKRGDPMEGYDHVVQPQSIPLEGAGQ